MTNPIDPTPESTDSAAHYRVSAQELSHVVGIIQARKEAEARQRANTVALGDAVEQLGLEMTPDELLAEIRADRARRSGSARPKRQQNSQRRTFLTFAVCAGLAGMMVSSIHMHNHNLNRAMWESRNNPMYLPGEFAPEASVAAPATTIVEPQQMMGFVEVETPASTQFRPFSEFGENEAADCDFDSLRKMADGASGSDIMVQANGTEHDPIGEDKLWTLVKKDGTVNVYAFGTTDELAKAINGHPAHLFASLHDGLQEELLPLRLFKNAELVDIPEMSGAELNPEVPAVTQGTWSYYYSSDYAPAPQLVYPSTR